MENKLEIIKQASVQMFKYDDVELPVKTYADGSIEFDAEQAAIGFGLFEVKNGKKYVIWKRVNKYLSTEVSKGDFITEPQFYKLAIKANNQVAEKFQDWVTSEVLPSIRKHGAYMTPEKVEEALLNPDTIIKLATQLKQEQEQRKQLQAENTRMKPKALFADAVSTAKTNILIGELAKILKANGVNHITVNGKQVTMGQNHFFQWLRENGYLIKRKGTDYNAPTQMAMNKKLFKVKESTSINADGTTRINKTTKVTGIGQQYFTNLFLAV